MAWEKIRKTFGSAPPKRGRPLDLTFSVRQGKSKLIINRPLTEAFAHGYMPSTSMPVVILQNGKAFGIRFPLHGDKSSEVRSLVIVGDGHGEMSGRFLSPSTVCECRYDADSQMLLFEAPKVS